MWIVVVVTGLGVTGLGVTGLAEVDVGATGGLCSFAAALFWVLCVFDSGASSALFESDRKPRLADCFDEDA